MNGLEKFHRHNRRPSHPGPRVNGIWGLIYYQDPILDGLALCAFDLQTEL